MVVIVFIIISDHLVIALADIALLKVREMGLGGLGGLGGTPTETSGRLWTPTLQQEDGNLGRLMEGETKQKET